MSRMIIRLPAYGNVDLKYFNKVTFYNFKYICNLWIYQNVNTGSRLFMFQVGAITHCL